MKSMKTIINKKLKQLLANKKGLGMRDLFPFVLTIVLVGMITGVGVLTLDKFSGVSGVTAAANTSIRAARDAVADIAEDWMALIVTIGILAVILGLVVGGFQFQGQR